MQERGTMSVLTEAASRADAAREFLREKLTGVEGVCVTSSFQAEDVVVLHMVRPLIADVPVLFLETGYHFPETLAYRDRMAAEWGLNLINVLPQKTVAEQEAEFGILNQTAPARCCAM